MWAGVGGGHTGHRLPILASGEAGCLFPVYTSPIWPNLQLVPHPRRTMPLATKAKTRPKAFSNKRSKASLKRSRLIQLTQTAEA